MERILNDNYEDKYTRATVVYAQATETTGTYTASYDEAGANPVLFEDLAELVTKGIVIKLNNYFFLPVAFGGIPFSVTFFIDGAPATLLGSLAAD